MAIKVKYKKKNSDKNLESFDTDELKRSGLVYWRL